VTIVLVHGVLGFGRLPALPGGPEVSYFNGIAGHVRERRHQVIEASLDPIGTVAKRAARLASLIETTQVADGEKVQIIAHSMGGLDAREAIRVVGDRVSTLVSIGTPYRGSPVADALVHGAGPLAGRLPTWLAAAFHGSALQALTTDAVAAVGTERDLFPPGVRYIEVAGDASRGTWTMPLFRVAEIVGGITGEINDGVVTRRSALVEGHEHLADWPVDHAGEIGWGYELPLAIRPFARQWPPVQAHFARYDAILDTLSAAGRR
jgi:triacylglycerol lipase